MAQGSSRPSGVKAVAASGVASRAIQELANMLDRQPESLLRGKQEEMQ